MSQTTLKTIILDTETTGFSAEHDDVLEIAIIDGHGKVLLNSLVRPVRKTEWPAAQAINGITPEMVANAPTLAELAPQIAAAFKSAQAVMYNAAFDYAFLKPCLGGMVEGVDFHVHCAMRRYSVVRGVWDGREGKNDYKRWRQVEAAAHVGHIWSGDAHRALADAQACRSIWQWSIDDKDGSRYRWIRDRSNCKRSRIFRLPEIDSLAGVAAVVDGCGERSQTFAERFDACVDVAMNGGCGSTREAARYGELAYFVIG